MELPSGVGFIALAGLAAEFGVVMLIYLKHAVLDRPSLASPDTATPAAIDEAIHMELCCGYAPKAMTVVTTVAGLLPIFWTSGTGSEVMTRITAPMLGGMISAAAPSMFILTAAYKLMLSWPLLRKHKGK